MINEFIMQTYRVNKDEGEIWHPPYESVENFQSPNFVLKIFVSPQKILFPSPPHPPPPGNI